MRILVCAADFTSRHLMQGVLAPYGSCDVASSGGEALQAICAAWEEGDPYRLICLEADEPGTDGLETLRELRRQEDRRAIKEADRARVILVAEVNELDEVMKVLQERCEACLAKPVSARRLLDRVVALGLAG